MIPDIAWHSRNRVAIYDANKFKDKKDESLTYCLHYLDMANYAYKSCPLSCGLPCFSSAPFSDSSLLVENNQLALSNIASKAAVTTFSSMFSNLASSR
jgi:hypothetical protein